MAKALFGSYEVHHSLNPFNCLFIYYINIWFGLVNKLLHHNFGCGCMYEASIYIDKISLNLFVIHAFIINLL